VLVTLTYAAAAVRMSRRGVLAQQLNAVELLASVDTICVDKTKTLTGSSPRAVESVPVRRRDLSGPHRGARDARGRRSSRNLTRGAIADAYRLDPPRVSGEGRSRADVGGARFSRTQHLRQSNCCRASSGPIKAAQNGVLSIIVFLPSCRLPCSASPVLTRRRTPRSADLQQLMSGVCADRAWLHRAGFRSP
jgi:hypothetical protein